MKEFDQDAEDAYMLQLCTTEPQDFKPRKSNIASELGAMLEELNEFAVWRENRQYERDHQEQEEQEQDQDHPMFGH